MMDSDFDLLFHRQGFLNFTYQPETRTDPQVLAQKWCHPHSGAEYLIDEFYRLFGKNDFRRALRSIYTAQDGVARDELAQHCRAALLDSYLTFMGDQELAVERVGIVYKSDRYQHVSDIGRTLEWYVARWFQEFLQCPARYNIHVPGMSGGGDLDVVAFMDGLRIWVECKSGSNIEDAQLRLFRERAQDFTPVMAILLIDTDDKKAMQRYIDRLDALGDPAHPFELKNPREQLYWRGRALYAVGVPNSIEKSLAAVLRLYHDYVRFVPFPG
jgi:hypothetical protein